MAEIDSCTNDVQDPTSEQVKSPYGEASFNPYNPPYLGRPFTTNCHGTSTGSCGDTIDIFLYIENDEVHEAGFLTNGCASSMMSGSMAANLALHKRSDDLTAITGEAILDNLGALLKGDTHCAWLAANALHDAVGDYYKKSILQSQKTEAGEPRRSDHD